MPTGGWEEFWEGAAYFVKHAGLIALGIIIGGVCLFQFLKSWGQRSPKQ